MRNDRAEWQRGGLYTPEGQFDAAPIYGVDLMFVPAGIRIDGPHLFWNAAVPLWTPRLADTVVGLDGDGSPRWRPLEDGLLPAFLRLEQGSDADILAFAREWGVFCDSEVCSGDWGTTEDGYAWSCELLADWRLHAKRVRTLLTLAARLQQGEGGAPQDWQLFDVDC